VAKRSAPPATCDADVSANPPSALAMYMAPHTPEDRNACIAEGAYFIAKRRGFTPGHELDDWLEAENEVDARLSGECTY
jgi:Protein of unknown function (DUF2934)